MVLTLELETLFLEALKVRFVKELANSIMTYVSNMIYIYPNNLPFWQFVTNPQQTNEI